MNDATAQQRTKNQQNLEDARKAIATGELFLLKYDAKLPDGLGDFYINTFGARYQVSLGHRSETDRNKALAHLGEVFGRSGWNATVGYGAESFNWAKKLDDVDITIDGAQPTGQPKSFPVDPKFFPLQLADTDAQ